MSDVSLGLAHETEVALRKAGAEREFWVKIARDPKVAEKVVELVNAIPAYTTYEVVVDYSRSLVEMINVGKYDWVNSEITAEHFPVQGEGRQGVELALFHFNQTMTSEQVIAKMDEKGYRPAKIEELLAFGEAQPDLQRQFPIIGLGSVWRDPRGGGHVPGLSGDVHERGIGLYWFGYGWSAYYRFVGVRK